jgi:carbonic anhydrase
MGIARVLVVVALAAVFPASAEEEKHWGYQGALSPAHWSQVSPTCGIGKRQSPVALQSKTARAEGTHDPLQFGWSKVLAELRDNGHTFQVTIPTGNFITVGPTRYELQQFHFHSPSEHTVDGKQAPLEAHFVHRSADGKLAVVAVLLHKATAASAYASVLGALPRTGETRTVDIDLPALLPQDRTHFAYSGSLTTPPCSEDVKWLVMLGPQELSAGEIDAFRAHYAKNARPVQPLAGRTVELAR